VLLENVDLASKTTLKIGGPADFYWQVRCLQELEEAWTFAVKRGQSIFFLGEGTNVLFSDQGYRGLVIRNRLFGRSREGREIWVAGGENLPGLITWLNRQGLGGMERMYGIPGTIAGAIVGNAGAYGQEISQVLRQVRIWRNGETTELDTAALDLSYRHSRFKQESDIFIVSCVLELSHETRDLVRESEDILAEREKKYPPGLACPGSFFKNVIFEELEPEIGRGLAPEFVMHGKVAAGKLLEAVGANGSREGGAGIANYHGNLLVNQAGADSHDILVLAQKYGDLVYERVGIVLEPEIRLAGDLHMKCPGEREADARRDSEIQN